MISITEVLKYFNQEFPPGNNRSSSVSYNTDCFDATHTLVIGVWYNGQSEFFEIEELELENLPKLRSEIQAYLDEDENSKLVYIDTRNNRRYTKVMIATSEVDNSKQVIYRELEINSTCWSISLDNFSKYFIAEP